MRSAPLTASTFGRVRDSLRQSLANFDNKQPVALAAHYRALALESPRYPVAELAAAAEAATLADVEAFQCGLLPEALLEALVAGNLGPAEAEAMASAVQAALPARGPLGADEVPRRRVRVPPLGTATQQFVARNAQEPNSATELYACVGPDEADRWVRLALLAQLLEQQFYEELRTRQQLGYIVQSAVTESEGVRGLVFYIQTLS